MNLICNLNEFNKNYIFFMETRNNMIMNGHFTKLIYSDENVTLNSIYFDFAVKYNIVKNNSNKMIIKVNVNDNRDIFSKISFIENNILQYYSTLNNISKKPVLLLKENLLSGFLKVYKQNNLTNAKIYFKISGVWETSSEIGITYKFIDGLII